MEYFTIKNYNFASSGLPKKNFEIYWGLQQFKHPLSPLWPNNDPQLSRNIMQSPLKNLDNLDNYYQLFWFLMVALKFHKLYFSQIMLIGVNGRINILCNEIIIQVNGN